MVCLLSRSLSAPGDAVTYDGEVSHFVLPVFLQRLRNSSTVDRVTYHGGCTGMQGYGVVSYDHRQRAERR